MSNVIQTIERLSLAAWPALKTLHYDGWTLRFADGYTRRANSVNPIASSSLDVDEKIAHCEALYSQESLKTVFKMTCAAFPPGLDDALAARGYVQEAETSVQTVPLADVAAPSLDSAVISERLNDGWLSVYCRLNQVDPHYLPIMKKMLASIQPPVCFIRLDYNHEAAAVGLGVLEDGYIGIYDVVTALHLRNHGLGLQMMLNLLQWGKANGAQNAYLSVMLNNPPALRLYEKIGFREQYQYWYRVKDLRSS